MAAKTRWISVRNWSKFQHYDPAKRVPPWIKAYVELLADEAYLRLSAHRRAVLHGIWLAYASSRCQLPIERLTGAPRAHHATLSLSSRLQLRVTTADLKALKDAGFLTFVASKTLAEGYHAASKTLASRAPAQSQETETAAEQEKDLKALDLELGEKQEPELSDSAAAETAEPESLTQILERLAPGDTDELESVAMRYPIETVRAIAAKVDAKKPRSPAGYFRDLLEKEGRRANREAARTLAAAVNAIPVEPSPTEKLRADPAAWTETLARNGTPVDVIEAGLTKMGVNGSERQRLLELAGAIQREKAKAPA
jgi:hypothetical protein